MKNLKRSIINLPAYEVPQKARIKLNQNESPYDIPAEHKREILERIKKIPWNRYPLDDLIKLKERLSIYTQHPEQGIMVSNGSNELILAIMLATCDKGDNIAFVTPGFAIYKYFAQILNFNIFEIPLKKDFSFDVDAIIRKALSTKIMFFASPNNPTGTAMEIYMIEEIVKRARGLVVIDEAYYEFHKLTAQRLLDKYRNLLILRTFSKAFGLAGIRLGYALGNAVVIKHIAKAKPPFSVGIFQQVAGNFMLGKKRFVQDTAAKIIDERERIFKILNNTPEIAPIPSRANFILFGLKRISGLDLFHYLYKKGILVRRFNHPYLENMLRVTIGKKEENNIFIRNLISSIQELGGK